MYGYGRRRSENPLENAGVKVPPKHGGWYYDGMHSDFFSELFKTLRNETQLMESVEDGRVRGVESYLPKVCGVESDWKLPCGGTIEGAENCKNKKKDYCYQFDRVKEIKNFAKIPNSEIIKRHIRGGILHLLKKDIQAFHQFNEENSVHHLDDFYINYLGVSKVGSNLNESYRGVVTSSFTPCIEHEDLIRAGWTYFARTFSKMDYDPEKGLFLPQEPSQMAMKQDEKKKNQLEDELGIKIELGFDRF